MRRLTLTLFLSLTALGALPGLAAAAPSLIGQVREFELGPGMRPQALVSGPDGNLWFAGIRYEPGQFADVVGRVTPKGKVTEFTLDSHQGNLGLSDIVVGPDGNLWFTEGGRPKVGRVTVDGQFTEFTLPDPEVSPMSMAAGADGNLWFTEFRGDKVGRVSPTGEVSEFSLRDAYRITAGPEGGLWIVSSDTIYRLATDGSSRVFRLPDSIRYPNEIISGPDGALWFGIQSRFGAGATPGLGRITTEGEISQVSVPGGRQTSALSSGPFEDIWYSNGAGRIGWILPGVATGTPACINSCRRPITSLTEGPDGRLWFAAGVAPLEAFDAPGTVGTYAPPPLEIKLVSDGHLEDGTLRLPVRCPLSPVARRCDGRLRLSGQGPTVQRRLSLRIGRNRGVALRLPEKSLRRLAARGRLVLRAVTSVADGREDMRRIVLHRR